MLNIIDEFAHEALAIRIDRRLKAIDVIGAVGAETAYIAPGSPWENAFIESFNARLRDALLDGEILYTHAEVKIVTESWRRHFNTVRPHGSLHYQPPAPEVFVPAIQAEPPRGGSFMPIRSAPSREYVAESSFKRSSFRGAEHPGDHEALRVAPGLAPTVRSRSTPSQKAAPRQRNTRM